MQTDIGDEIAKLALHHYNTVLPTKGKPQQGREWTVFAAIIARECCHSSNSNTTGSNLWVVSSATGTKCCCIPAECQSNLTARLCILHDSHAEVLARRGLVRVLATEMQEHSRKKEDIGTKQRLLEKYTDRETGRELFRLRSDLSLHLFVSDSPCGDASIYAMQGEQDDIECDDAKKQQTKFTGAKLVVSNNSKVSPHEFGEIVWSDATSKLAREPNDQVLGKVRSKAGRSNLPPNLRSRSMSCSDKLVRWSILGLQGGRLLRCIPRRIQFSSIIIGHDPQTVMNNDGSSAQLQAAQRIAARVCAVKNHLEQQKLGQDSFQVEFAEFLSRITVPTIHISQHTFPSGKSSGQLSGATSQPQAGAKRKRNNNLSPAGLSINWQYNEQVELTVGVRGIRQGKRPRAAHDYQSLHSRLSRYALSLLSVDGPGALGHHEVELEEYAQSKRQSEFSVWIREQVLMGEGPLQGWLVGDCGATASKQTKEP